MPYVESVPDEDDSEYVESPYVSTLPYDASSADPTCIACTERMGAMPAESKTAMAAAIAAFERELLSRMDSTFLFLPTY
ncbi:MAG: hypothetical protein IKF14_10620 [Atopobiaceae bacterium]|nr:hypothetical protein [Atopobiaceae bacterium]